MTDSVLPTALATSLRTHTGGSLRAEHAGTVVRLGGWVHRSRDLGGLVFIDLRDRDGLVQLSFDPAFANDEARAVASAVGIESVVLVEGEVVLRPAERRNPEMETGDVEVRATSIRVVGAAETPAIPVARGRTEKLPSEDLRLRYRYLDLRRPELQRNLVLRHRLAQTARRYLSDAGFLEIETPILTKPTPEGARDYLVPSRVHPGEFYALPQSPQIYKQLFMVAGLDRYFQIARCFRDEDLRADRQPEFTQIDVEASFVDQDDIIRVTEGMLAALFAVAGVQVSTPFRRMTYADAMERYGIDRPDLRYGLELHDLTARLRGYRLRGVVGRDRGRGALSRIRRAGRCALLAEGAGRAPGPRQGRRRAGGHLPQAQRRRARRADGEVPSRRRDRAFAARPMATWR